MYGHNCAIQWQIKWSFDENSTSLYGLCSSTHVFDSSVTFINRIKCFQSFLSLFFKVFSSPKRQMSPISSHKNVKNIARHRAISKISKSSKDKKTRCSYSILIDHENCGTLELKRIFNSTLTDVPNH